MSGRAFTAAGGVSQQDAIVGHVFEAEPGTVFTYGQMGAVLTGLSGKVYDLSYVQAVVRLAKMRLLRDHQRTLEVVPTVGYRVARASDHRHIAARHTRKGNRQMHRALVTVENARLDEMTAAERELHLAQCTINQQLYQEQRRVQRKQSRVDDIIARLTSRVEQLEAKRGEPEPAGVGGEPVQGCPAEAGGREAEEP